MQESYKQSTVGYIIVSAEYIKGALTAQLEQIPAGYIKEALPEQL